MGSPQERGGGVRGSPLPRGVWGLRGPPRSGGGLGFRPPGPALPRLLHDLGDRDLRGMSGAPAAFRAGISVLTPRLGTTVSTAFIFPRASVVIVGEDRAGSMSVTAASRSAGTLSFSRTLPRAWMAPRSSRAMSSMAARFSASANAGAGRDQLGVAAQAALRGSAGRSCAATNRSRSGPRSRPRCRAPWPRSRRRTVSPSP